MGKSFTKSYKKFIAKAFKIKSTDDILIEKVDQILKDILISGFENYEISIIIQALTKETKLLLEERKIILEKELEKTIFGINNL